MIRDTACELPQPGVSVRLDDAACSALQARRDACIDSHLPAIVNEAAANPSPIARIIDSHSRRISQHVLEGAIAVALSFAVLEAKLACGLRIEPSYILGMLSAHGGGWLARTAHMVWAQADVLYYLLLVPLWTWSLRLLQRRSLLHRQGVRELLIGDTRYVRQIVWLFARKLFSLSYGFASIKPYCADNQDDLIMTHEPLRGSLALFGLPDARRSELQEHNAAAVMTARQFAASRSVGAAGAEVITIGHAAHGPAGPCHVALPASEVPLGEPALDLLIEGLYDSWERMLAMQLLIYRLAKRVAAFYPGSYDVSRTKDQVFAPTTASPVAAAFNFAGAQLKESLRFSRVSLPFQIRSPLRAADEADGPPRQRTARGV